MLVHQKLMGTNSMILNCFHRAWEAWNVVFSCRLLISDETILSLHAMETGLVSVQAQFALTEASHHTVWNATARWCADGNLFKDIKIRRIIAHSPQWCETESRKKEFPCSHAWRYSGCTRATLRCSVAWVSGHCISHQLMGTIWAPSSQKSDTEMCSYSCATLCSHSKLQKCAVRGTWFTLRHHHSQFILRRRQQVIGLHIAERDLMFTGQVLMVWTLNLNSSTAV